MEDNIEELLFGAGTTDLPTSDDRIDEYLGYTGSDESIAPFFEPARADEYLGHVSTFDPATGTGVFPFEMTGAPRQTGSFMSGIQSLLSALTGKGTGLGGGQGVDFLKFLIPLLLAKKAYKEAKGTKVEKGGGTAMGPTGARDTGRYLTVGPTGQPIFAYKYAQGGAVRPFPMQDGGFVFTGDAVEGAGGIKALQQMVPDAQPIRGPGTKTSDSIPAYIEGRNKVTPARVSNGEAYAPPGYDTKGLYALMKALERNA